MPLRVAAAPATVPAAAHYCHQSPWQPRKLHRCPQNGDQEGTRRQKKTGFRGVSDRRRDRCARAVETRRERSRNT